MTAQEKAIAAVQKLEEQLIELNQIKTKDALESSDRLDRWFSRTKKIILKNINKQEHDGYLEYKNMFAQTTWDLVNQSIDSYRSRLNALMEELKKYPDTIFEDTVEDSNTADDTFFNQIHPSIVKTSKDQFSDEYFSESVFSAFKAVNNRVKAHVKAQRGKELDGRDLMMKAFSEADPVIVMGDQSTESGRNMQEGYRFIFAGSIQAIRNPKAHDHIEIDRNRAIHFLYLASLEMFKLDEAKVP